MLHTSPDICLASLLPAWLLSSNPPKLRAPLRLCGVWLLWRHRVSVSIFSASIFSVLPLLALDKSRKLQATASGGSMKGGVWWGLRKKMKQIKMGQHKGGSSQDHRPRSHTSTSNPHLELSLLHPVTPTPPKLYQRFNPHRLLQGLPLLLVCFPQASCHLSIISHKQTDPNGKSVLLVTCMELHNTGHL